MSNHPLFTYSALLCLYLVALYNLAQLGRDANPDDIDENFEKFGQFRFHYFTTWNFVLQISFLVIAILHEISALLDLDLGIQKLLGRTRSFLFSALLLPNTCLVITVFWGIWHIDRELIFPKAIDAFFPWWLNQVLHTFVAIPVIVEVLLPRKYHFVSFKKAALVIISYLTVYQCLYFSVYLRYGVWLYPIYQYLTWLERIIFTLVQCTGGLICQRIGLAIQNTRRVKASDKQI